MGVPAASAQFLIEAANSGVSFERTATIGRQHLAVGPRRLGRLLRSHGRWPEGATRADLSRTLAQDFGWADPLFHLLGAKKLTAIDASDYEGADLVLDLNAPVPEELHDRFSLVFDGGSLEHIFNAPLALGSLMRMVEVGGHLVMTSPANNYFGHGLYQFGPDFFYRALSPESGYEVERMFALHADFEAGATFLGRNFGVEKTGPRYAVANPQLVGERVQLVNRHPVMLFVQAKRVSHAPIFARHPQQSDYPPRWAEHSAVTEHRGPAPNQHRRRSLRGRMLTPRTQLYLALDVMPQLARLFDPLRHVRLSLHRSLRNRRHYKRVRG